MINHYLLTLTPDQEHRVLTHKMAPGCYTEQEHRGPCLVGTACNAPMVQAGLKPWYLGIAPPPWRKTETIEDRYDGLCARFGVARTNAAIRSRILSNQARRTLQRDVVPAMEAV